MEIATVVVRIWFKTKVPIYVERFILPILAGTILVIVMQNAFSLTWDQRVAVFLVVASSAYLFATAVHRTNLLTPQVAKPPTSQASAGQPPAADPTPAPQKPPQTLPGAPALNEKKEAAFQSFTVTSNNQQGGITAGIVNVSPTAPKRRIPDGLKAKMVAFLSQNPGAAELYFPAGDPEAERFAMDIEEVLRAAGWDAKIEAAVISSESLSGARITFHGDPVKPGDTITTHKPSEASLGSVLNSLEIGLVGKRDPAQREGLVKLEIGHRPD